MASLKMAVREALPPAAQLERFSATRADFENAEKKQCSGMIVIAPFVPFAAGAAIGINDTGNGV